LRCSNPENQLAFLVGGPKAGELMEVPCWMPELEAFQLSPNWAPVQVAESPRPFIDLPRVRYKPAVPRGFLWYVQ
jgi:hypothetical protein